MLKLKLKLLLFAETLDIVTEIILFKNIIMIILFNRTQAYRIFDEVMAAWTNNANTKRFDWMI